MMAKASAMPIRPVIVILAGALLTGTSAYVLAEPMAPHFIDRLEDQASQAIAEAGGSGVTARFANGVGSLSRYENHGFSIS